MMVPNSDFSVPKTAANGGLGRINPRNVIKGSLVDTECQNYIRDTSMQL